MPGINCEKNLKFEKKNSIKKLEFYIKKICTQCYPQGTQGLPKKIKQLELYYIDLHFKQSYFN